MNASQQQVLNKFVNRIDFLLHHSLQYLQYAKCTEIDTIRDQLNNLHNFFTTSTMPTKSDLKSNVETLEQLSYFMITLYAETLTSDVLERDDTYKPDVDLVDAQYKEKIAKSLEAKQKRAPGFDGQGGGQSRRS